MAKPDRNRKVFARPTVATVPAKPGGAPRAAGDIVLSPRDGLFLKDGREWGPAGASWAHSLEWPAPSTLLGALRTACGRSAEQRDGKLWGAGEWKELESVTSLGASVALRRPLALSAASTPVDWNARHRVWPVPADALFLNDKTGKKHKKVLRLDPTSATPGLGSDECPAREALWRPMVEDRGKPARAPNWWSDDIWTGWLSNPMDEVPWTSPSEDNPGWIDPLSGLALSRHVQIHVGIDRATGAAKDEILFGHDVIESLDDKQHEWAIGCQFASNRDQDDPGRRATIGGDRRLAGLERASKLFAMPDTLALAFRNRQSNGLRLIAVTPAAFADGWLPPDFTVQGSEYRGHLPKLADELILRACMVPRAGHVSGWDMARRQPKPTTRLVPPGSVYHFVKVNRAPFSETEARDLWLAVLGSRGGEGFGRFVPGLWFPKENGQ